MRPWPWRTFSVGGSLTVCSRLIHPEVRVAVADQIEQPPEQSETVVTSESEPIRVDSERVGERAGIVIDRTKRVRDDVSHRLWILALVEQVRGDPGRARYGQSSETDPLAVSEPPGVESDVLMSRLTPSANREVMDVSGKMAETVHLRS